MTDNVEDFLRSFCGAMVAAELYPLSHPQVAKLVQTTHQLLDRLLQEQNELVFAMVEHEIVYEGHILFELSHTHEALIACAAKKNIEKIYLFAGIGEEEVTKFIAFLISTDPAPADGAEHLESLDIYHIKVSRLTAPDGPATHKTEPEYTPYERALKLLGQFYSKIEKRSPGRQMYYQDLKAITLIIRNSLADNYWDMIDIKPKEGYDIELVHRLNVGMLTAMTAARFGFEPEDLIHTIMASLLYNIGFGQQEQGIYRYFMKNALILLQYKDEFGVLPVIVAHETALMNNPSYYSQQEEFMLLLHRKPHTVSKMIAVCDYFDRLIYQNYAQENFKQKVKDILINDKSRKFDAQMMEQFFKIVSL